MPTANPFLLHAAIPNAAARLMANPSEYNGGLDGDNGSGDVLAM
jgi:hypothetical protein